MTLKEMYNDWRKSQTQGKNQQAVTPTQGTISCSTPIPKVLGVKGFPSSYLQLHGRPKKLANWGFRLECATPGKVKVIL